MARISRKELDALLEEMNEHHQRLGIPEQKFYITHPGDRYGTRYQLKRADTNSDCSEVMSGREMEKALRTAISVHRITDNRGNVHG